MKENTAKKAAEHAAGETKAKRYTLQNDAFQRVEALAQEYIKTHERHEAEMMAVSKTLWDGVEAECEGIDLKGNNYRLNREYAEDGIIFIEGGCDCPAHSGEGLLGGLLASLRDASTSVIDEDDLPIGKKH